MIKALIRSLAALSLAAIAANCSTPLPAPQSPVHAIRDLQVSGDCRLSAADHAWLKGALSAWHFVRKETLRAANPVEIEALVFDKDCAYSIASGAFETEPVLVSAHSHANVLELPGGERLDVEPMAFLRQTGDFPPQLVMASASFWPEDPKPGALSNPTFFTGVMLHELSHAMQARTYLSRVAASPGIEALPRPIDDDMVQRLFEKNPQYEQAITHEFALLAAVHAAPTHAEAVAILRKFVVAYRARQLRFLTGQYAPLRSLEDNFLTLEGSGQWAAFSWHRLNPVLPRQGETAWRVFAFEEKYWSQRMGFLLFAAIDRLVPDWQKQIYGDGSRTAIELLECTAAQRNCR